MIGHVALEVRREDVDDEVAFWALLGYGRVQPPGTLGERSAWVARGEAQVHLMFSDEPVAPPNGHTAILPDDYAATCARLRDAGHAVDPRAEHWGAPRAFVRSPGGHRVELMAALPRRGPR